MKMLKFHSFNNELNVGKFYSQFRKVLNNSYRVKKHSKLKYFHEIRCLVQIKEF